MALILTAVNAIWPSDDRWLLDNLIIASIAAIADEVIRLLRRAAIPGFRRQAALLAAGAAAGWGAALWLTRASPARVSWIVGGTVGLVGFRAAAAGLTAWKARRGARRS